MVTLAVVNCPETVKVAVRVSIVVFVATV